MHHERFSRWAFESAQPSQDFSCVRMRRQTGNTFDMSADRYYLTMDSDFSLTVLESSASSAGRLISSEDHGAGRIRKPLREMMKHSSTGCHTRSRDDYPWPLQVIQQRGTAGPMHQP